MMINSNLHMSITIIKRFGPKISKSHYMVPTQKYPFPVGGPGPCLVQCYVGPYECPCQMASYSVKRL